MSAFGRTTKNYVHILAAVTVIALCGLMAIWALKAGAVGVASFFGVILLQAWCYVSFLALTNLISVFKAARSIW